jgi:hypothetical protein
MHIHLQLGGQIRIEIDVAALVKEQKEMKTDISQVSDAQERIERSFNTMINNQVG